MNNQQKIWRPAEKKFSFPKVNVSCHSSTRVMHMEMRISTVVVSAVSIFIILV